MTADLLVAVDGGQTSTKALIAGLDGAILGYGSGGPSDHFHSLEGEARNRAAIHGAIRAAYAAAGLAPSSVAAIALGLTGVQRGGPEVLLVEQIVREIVQPASMAVLSDYVTNLAGASAGEAGVVVVAGGGSIAYGVTADRAREAIAGGMGYLLGDEGSAYDIGRRAVGAAARAADGRGERTTLEAVICDTFNLVEVRTITRVVYAAGFARERLAALAPLVAREAAAGDAVASQIMQEAGHELAQLALAVLRRLGAGDESLAVYPTGGVFRAGAVVERPFAAALQQGWPRAEVRSAKYPPVVGALLVARDLCGLSGDPAWLENMERTIR